MSAGPNTPRVAPEPSEAVAAYVTRLVAAAPPLLNADLRGRLRLLLHTDGALQ
jgi:hypothetical protein